MRLAEVQAENLMVGRPRMCIPLLCSLVVLVALAAEAAAWLVVVVVVSSRAAKQAVAGKACKQSESASLTAKQAELAPRTGRPGMLRVLRVGGGLMTLGGSLELLAGPLWLLPPSSALLVRLVGSLTLSWGLEVWGLVMGGLARVWSTLRTTA